MARNIAAMMANFDGRTVVESKHKGKSVDTVHEAAELLEEDIFPEHKSCQDCCCILLFAVMVGFVVGVAGLCLPSLLKIEGVIPADGGVTAAPTVAPVQAFAVAPTTSLAAIIPPAIPHRLLYGYPTQAPQVQVPGVPGRSPGGGFDITGISIKYLVGGVTAGCFMAFVAVIALLCCARSCARCVVRTALLFSCVMLILMGFYMIAIAASYGPLSMLGYIGGGIMIFLGCCMACFWLFCGAQLIEFTAKVLEMVVMVTMENTGMFVVALIGAVQTALWNILVAVAFFSFLAYVQQNDELSQKLFQSKYASYAVFFVWFFCYFWGGLAIAGVCYTTYCGVFGRWYFSTDGNPRHRKEYESGTLCSSYFTAQFWNFGSILYGTGLVSIIRAAEYTARCARRDAQSEGDWITCIILCCIECILDCLGDILEFFNEWGYVQCAIRNVSYCQGVRLVFGLLTWRNALPIISSWLMDSVVNFGSFLAGCLAAMVGASVGYVANSETAMIGGFVGFFLGMMLGWCCWCIVTAGAKTLLTCWCEHPDTLFTKADDSEYEGEDGDMVPKSVGEEFNAISPFPY